MNSSTSKYDCRLFIFLQHVFLTFTVVVRKLIIVLRF